MYIVYIIVLGNMCQKIKGELRNNESAGLYK